MKYLITGVSSGIGRELTKKLILDGQKVFGVARRKGLLLNLKKELGNSTSFNFMDIDISSDDAWENVIKRIRIKNFSPNVVIFNAAIFEKDYLGETLDFYLMKKTFEINFFSIIKGFEAINKIAKKNTQFIFISSSSALKGSGSEGIGYPASKAALSAAFESLYQKYKKKYQLKIIYFGPVDTDMSPSTSRFRPSLSISQAVKEIIKATSSKRVINYSPWPIFLLLRIIKIMPDYLYLTILDLIDILHVKSSKKK